MLKNLGKPSKRFWEINRMKGKSLADKDDHHKQITYHPHRTFEKLLQIRLR